MADILGRVAEIQPLSVHDGDGIRTVVFLAGCPLRCLWCANPETWASPGAMMTALQVVERVMRDGVFFRASGGGVTFSGGEATEQPEFLKALIEAFGVLGVDMALETACTFRWEDLSGHLGGFSRIFADIKHMDANVHRQVTGRENTEILQNIRRIGTLGIPVTLRIPLIPGINDTAENLTATARFAAEAVPGAAIEVLPYHSLGTDKCRALAMTPPTFRVPDAAAVNAARRIIEAAGVETVSWR